MSSAPEIKPEPVIAVNLRDSIKNLSSDGRTEVFDFSKKIKQLTQSDDIYLTEEDQIIKYFSDLQELEKKKIYAIIGRAIITEWVGLPPVDFKRRMKELEKRLTEIEVMTAGSEPVTIRFGGGNQILANQGSRNPEDKIN